MMLQAEPSFLYSSRSYWYPQAPVSDYATARIRISVPPAIDCVASGELEPGFPAIVAGKDPDAEPQGARLHGGAAAALSRLHPQPLLRAPRRRRSRSPMPGSPRYRPDPRRRTDAAAEKPLAGPVYRSLNLSVEANPRQVQRGRELAERTAEIAMFYESIIGDSPYSSFTVALIESDLPGGHSPGYFAALEPAAAHVGAGLAQRSGGVPQLSRFLHRPRARAPVVGTGGRLAQLPRAMDQRGLRAVLRRVVRAAPARRRGLRRRCCGSCGEWGMDATDQGPIYLGYRLGHIRSESRVFRALVSQQERRGAAHAAAPGRRRRASSAACGASTATRASARSAPRTSARRWRRRPAARSSASSSAGSTARRCRS